MINNSRNKNIRLKTKTFLSTFGMTQKRFSENVGYADNTISAWLTGKLDLSDKGLALIENFLEKYEPILTQVRK